MLARTHSPNVHAMQIEMHIIDGLISYNLNVFYHQWPSVCVCAQHTERWRMNETWIVCNTVLVRCISIYIVIRTHTHFGLSRVWLWVAQTVYCIRIIKIDEFVFECDSKGMLLDSPKLNSMKRKQNRWTQETHKSWVYRRPLFCV